MHLKHQFYKKYYENLDPRFFEDKDEQKKVDERNEKIFNTINSSITGYKTKTSELAKWLFTKQQFPAGLIQFPLKTTYPGLLSGTGYNHETGSTGEFKIGFHFDHTSGLPILPGHSVKGCLRSSFPRDSISKESASIKKAKAAYILDILGITIPVDQQLEWVNTLELAIFEGKHSDHSTIKRKDVFLDAQIKAPDQKGHILGSDAITPHGDKVWKNPTPLLFIKVLPEVIWQFSFLLHNSKIFEVEISATLKEKLF